MVSDSFLSPEMVALAVSCRFIADGIPLTLMLTAGGMAVSSVVGVVLASMRYSGCGSGAATAIISLLRGTPLLLQLNILYFLLPRVVGMPVPLGVAAIVALGINSSAYVAEILRSGVESLPRGQFEAAYALRIPAWHMWKDITGPQILRNVLPALVNEFITLLKETALISTLGGMDITRRAQVIGAEQFTYFLPLCVSGLYYYLLTLLVDVWGRWMEKKYAL